MSHLEGQESVEHDNMSYACLDSNCAPSFENTEGAGWRRGRCSEPPYRVCGDAIAFDDKRACSGTSNCLTDLFGVGELPSRSSSISFCSTSSITFVLGRVVSEQHIESKEQRFLARLNSRCTAIAVSLDRRLVAVATMPENQDQFASVLVLMRDSGRLVMRKAFGVLGNISSLTFSTNSSCVGASGGMGGKYAVSIWEWKSRRVIATGTMKNLISQVRFAISDNSLLVAAGTNYLKSLRVSGMVLQEERLLTPTQEGAHCFIDVLVLERSVYIAISDEHSLLLLVGSRLFRIVDCRSETSQWKPHDRLISLCQCEGGFVVGTSAGTLIIFHLQVRDTNMGLKARLQRDIVLCCGGGAELTSITSDLEGKQVLCLRKCAPALLVDLCHARLLEDPSEAFRPVLHERASCTALISSSPLGLAGSVVTADASQLVQIWDPSRRCCTHSLQLHEKILFVSGHPNGFQLLIGSRKCIVLYHVLVDRIKSSFTANICNVAVAAYSHSGHAVAFARGANIHVHSALDISPISISSRHSSSVSSFVWSHDDVLICSATSNGMCMLTEARSGVRLSEFGCWNAEFFDITCSLRSEHLMLISDQRRLFLLDSKRSEQLSDTVVDLDFDATVICFDANRSLIIMGTIDGDIALLDWPVVSDTRPRIFPSHNGKVTGIFVDVRGRVVSTSEDGSIRICEFCIERGRSEMRSAQPRFEADSDIVMVALSEHQRDIRKTRELNAKIVSSKTLHLEQIKELEDKSHQQIQNLQKRLEDTVQSKNEEIERLQMMVERTRQQLMERLDHEIRTSEESREQLREELEMVLNRQYERYDALEKQLKDTQASNSEERKQIIKLHADEMQYAEERAAKQRNDLLLQVRELQQKEAEKICDYEAVIRSMETEHDGEFSEFQDRNRKSLVEQMAATRKALADASMVRQKLSNSQAQMSAATIRIGELEAHNKHANHYIQTLKNELLAAKKDIRSREKEIALSSRELTLSRSDSSKLQNLQGILEHRVNELQETQRPAYNYIKQLLNSIQGMDAELGQKNRKALMSQITEESKTLQNRALNETVSRLRSLMAHKNRKLDFVNRELSNIVETANVKEWPVEVLRLYKALSGSTTTEPVLMNRIEAREEAFEIAPTSSAAAAKAKTSDSNREAEACEEWERHRRILEKELQILRQKLKACEKSSAGEQRRKTKENQALIESCNQLRIANATLHKRISSLETKLSQSESRGSQQEEAPTPPSRNTNISRRAASARLLGTNTESVRSTSTAGHLFRGSTHAMHTSSILQTENARLRARLEAATNRQEELAYQLSQLQEALSVSLSWANTDARGAALRSLGVELDTSAAASTAVGEVTLRPFSASTLLHSHKPHRRSPTLSSRSTLSKSASASTNVVLCKTTWRSRVSGTRPTSSLATRRRH